MADLFMNSSFKVVASLMSLHTYAKCGSIDDAWRVFNKMSSQHVVTWNAIIYRTCETAGRGRRHWNYFYKCSRRVYSQIMSLLFVFCELIAMQVWWMKACTVMLQWSQTYDFSKIGTVHLCVGCAGHLEEAENMIKAIPCKPYIVVWTALLVASRTHGNVEMGEQVAK
jgi:pentatricopeptide repeat protein